MPDDLDARRLEAWRALLTAHRRVLDRLEYELRTGHDLSLSEYEVLMLLGQASGNRSRMGELARRLLVTPGGVTRIADRLERAGLLQREPCPADRRSVELVLTPEGRRRLRAAARDHLRGVARHFGAHLTGGEADSLAELLGRVAGAGRDVPQTTWPADDASRGQSGALGPSPRDTDIIPGRRD